MLTFLSLIICYSVDKSQFFYCYCGLAYIDVCKLSENEIRKAFDDQLWIMTERSKTKEKVNVRLFDIPLAIIEKYKGQRVRNNGRILPVSTNQKMNEYLKEIATVCGIEKPLSTHTFRHSISSSPLIIRSLQNNIHQQVTIKKRATSFIPLHSSTT